MVDTTRYGYQLSQPMPEGPYYAEAQNARVQRLPLPITDREVVAVANFLLETRRSPMGEIDIARAMIEILDNTRNTSGSEIR